MHAIVHRHFLVRIIIGFVCPRRNVRSHCRNVVFAVGFPIVPCSRPDILCSSVQCGCFAVPYCVRIFFQRGISFQLWNIIIAAVPVQGAGQFDRGYIPYHHIWIYRHDGAVRLYNRSGEGDKQFVHAFIRTTIRICCSGRCTQRFIQRHVEHRHRSHIAFNNACSLACFKSIVRIMYICLVYVFQRKRRSDYSFILYFE